MRVECHNKDCKNIFNFSGKDSWVNCPVCSSRIPLSKTSDVTTDDQVNHENYSSTKK